MSSTQVYAEYSVVRTRISKTDDKGRPVAAGMKGTIVHVYPTLPDDRPAYIVEVIIIDAQGTPSDSYIFDAFHDQLELVEQ
jgi:hypothetical protein